MSNRYVASSERYNVIGMDRATTTDELSAFTAGSTLTGNQLAFVSMLLDHLIKRGAVARHCSMKRHAPQSPRQARMGCSQGRR